MIRACRKTLGPFHALETELRNYCNIIGLQNNTHSITDIEKIAIIAIIEKKITLKP